MSLKEEDLTIKYAGDIQPGQRFTKIGSKFVPIGGSSGDTSAFESEMTAIIGEDANIPPVLVSGMKFYKCASVDTTSKMWSGYELILTDGVYTVSETLTDGLSYSAVTPVVGNTYSEDVLILASPYMGWKAPTDGLVFYAPLAEASDTAETGQSFTANTEIVYSVEQGIPCMYVDNFTAYFADTGLPAGNSSRTMSCWVKRNEQFSGIEATFFSYGTGATRKSMDFCFHKKYNSFAMDLYEGSLGVPKQYNHTMWHHVLYTYDITTNKACIYVDGILGVSSTSYTPNTVLAGRVYIGRGASGDWPFGQGHIAACRIYNRVLTQEEITTLANEFTPTTA